MATAFSSSATDLPKSVTVLIAAYNSEGFIARAIDSAMAQTLPAHEILIVDDASADNTAALVETLSARNDKIRLVRLRENGGPSAARNAGLLEATGAWVAILDADDAFQPDRLRHMVDIGLESGADIVLDNFSYYISRTNEILPPALKTGALQVIGTADYLDKARPFNEEADYGLLKPLFRRAFLVENEKRYPVFSRHGEDFLFMMDLLLSGAKCVVTREAGYLYTDRSSGMSRTSVNYELMITHSRALLGHDKIKGDEALETGLAARIESLEKLCRVTDYNKSMDDMRHFSKSRDYGFFMKRFCASASFRKIVFGILTAKVGKAISHGKS